MYIILLYSTRARETRCHRIINILLLPALDNTQIIVMRIYMRRSSAISSDRCI